MQPPNLQRSNAYVEWRRLPQVHAEGGRGDRLLVLLAVLARVRGRISPSPEHALSETDSQVKLGTSYTSQYGKKH